MSDKEIKIVVQKTSEEIADQSLVTTLLQKVLDLNEKFIALIKEKAIPGPQGAKGEKGDKGDQGIPGVSIKGDKGEPGDNGKDGKDGINGEKGDKGDKGDNGKDGINGSPDTAEQIVAKLNTLESVLDLKVLKGFQQFTDNVQTELRRKQTGGGMGNWVHQAFSTTSATTTVTLRSDVAANGNAVLVRYQGQLLAHGSQYTISNNVITFTFTLEDNTTVDVTYVRT